jgi:hypothetical protein
MYTTKERFGDDDNLMDVYLFNIRGRNWIPITTGFSDLVQNAKGIDIQVVKQRQGDQDVVEKLQVAFTAFGMNPQIFVATVENDTVVDTRILGPGYSVDVIAGPRIGNNTVSATKDFSVVKYLIEQGSSIDPSEL